MSFYQIKDDDIGYEASVFANRAIACREGTPEDLLKAMRLYQAVKIICEKKAGCSNPLLLLPD